MVKVVRRSGAEVTFEVTVNLRGTLHIVGDGRGDPGGALLEKSERRNNLVNHVVLNGREMKDPFDQAHFTRDTFLVSLAE